MNKADLAKSDFELILDKSGSMADQYQGRAKWQYAQEMTIGLARFAEKYDDDGITVVPFSNNYKVFENISHGDEAIANLFKEEEPYGGTDTARVLKARIEDFFTSRAKGNPKARILIIITDGAPNDNDAVGHVIADATKRLSKENIAADQLNIEFIQVGDDAGATAFLKFLDEDLAKLGATHDIVDTTRIDDVGNFSFEDLLTKARS